MASRRAGRFIALLLLAAPIAHGAEPPAKLVKQGNTWKIDTSKKVLLPLEFFFR